MTFILLMLLGMYVGRKLGWALSRGVLYRTVLPAAILGCIVWGAASGFLVHAMLVWQRPGWLLRWVFGYALGAYVAIPNYGLVLEPTVPASAIPRHQVIGVVPLLSYLASSVAFAWLPLSGQVAVILS